MDDFDQLIRRATEHYKALRLTDAVAAYREAATLRPDVAGVHNNLGSALMLLGQLDEAIAALEEALRLDPNLFQTWNNVGNLYKTRGQLDRAIANYRRAIEINPANAETHNNLAATLQEVGDIAGAIAEYQQAAKLRPESAVIGSNLLYAMHFSSAFTAADLLAAHRTWNERFAKPLFAKVTPVDVRPHPNLLPGGEGTGNRSPVQSTSKMFGTTLSLPPGESRSEGERGPALIHSKKPPIDPLLLQRARAMRHNPAPAEQKLWACLRDRQLGDYKFRRQTPVPPFVADFYCHDCRLVVELDGESHGEREEYDESRTTRLERDGFHVIRFLNEDVHRHLDAVLREILFCCERFGSGEPVDLSGMRRPIDARPHPNFLPEGEGTRGRSPVQSTSIISRTNPSLPSGESRSEGERKIPLPATQTRRLRIGYISPDLRHHPIGRFMRPILANHDRSAFEIFCYSDALVPDAMTADLRKSVDHWQVIRGLPDGVAFDLIRKHDLDLLVDLTMHLARNRLLVLARKPARVQASYLAYCSTTGMDAIDFRITDPHLDPPTHGARDGALGDGSSIAGGAPVAPHPNPLPKGEGTSDLSLPSGEGQGEGERDALPYSERSVRLPESYWCYEPPAEAPDVGPLSARGNGFVTFGCLNNFGKVSPAALSTWIEILRQVPGSRLILHAKEGAHQELVREALMREGVESSRLTFVGSVPFEAYFAQYNQIDIGLDPFPYGGGTTSFDALWMGVPIVTLRGETAVGRGGVSILMNLGLAELIAGSADEYTRLVIGLANDQDRLATLRCGLRERMRQSIVTDPVRFTRQLEDAYRTMVAASDPI